MSKNNNSGIETKGTIQDPPSRKEQLLELLKGYDRDIYELDLSPYSPFVDNDILEFIGKTFTELGELNLKNCHQINDDGLKFLEKLPLRGLELSDCKKISNTGLDSVSKLKLLKVLKLASCNTISKKGIAKLEGLPLEILDLRSCFTIDKKYHKTFHSQSEPPIDILIKIMSGEIKDRVVDYRNKSEIEKTPQAILNKELELLKTRERSNLAETSSILNDKVKLGRTQIDDNTLFDSRFLKRKGVDSPNDVLEQLHNISFHHPRLVTLDIFAGNAKWDITNEVLQFIGKKFSHLQKLNLESCYAITDKGLEALKELPLTDLNLSGCCISNKGVASLSQLNSLEVINLSHCDNLHKELQKDFKSMTEFREALTKAGVPFEETKKETTEKATTNQEPRSSLSQTTAAGIGSVEVKGAVRD